MVNTGQNNRIYTKSDVIKSRFLVLLLFMDSTKYREHVGLDVNKWAIAEKEVGVTEWEDGLKEKKNNSEPDGGKDKETRKLCQSGICNNKHSPNISFSFPLYLGLDQLSSTMCH